MTYIILGIIMVVYAWMHLAYGMLQKNKKDARIQWVRINALLQTRSDYILKLLELLADDDFGVVKKYDALEDNQEIQELISDLIELEESITFESVKYNKSIDLYNVHREKPSLKIQIAILGASPLKGFHVRNF